MHAERGCFVCVGVASFVDCGDIAVVNVLLSRVAFDFVKGDASRAFGPDKLEEEPFKVAVRLQTPRFG